MCLLARSPTPFSGVARGRSSGRVPGPPRRDPASAAPGAPPSARSLCVRVPGPQEGHAGPGSTPGLSPTQQSSHTATLGRALAPGLAHRGPALRSLQWAAAAGRHYPGSRRGGAVPQARRPVHGPSSCGSVARASCRRLIIVHRLPATIGSAAAMHPSVRAAPGSALRTSFFWLPAFKTPPRRQAATRRFASAPPPADVLLAARP